MIPDKIDANYRICNNCNTKMYEGYILGNRHACCEECGIALYDGDEDAFWKDIDPENDSCGTYCYVDSF